MPTTALAAEVRFSRHIGRSYLSAHDVRDRRLERRTSGAKVCACKLSPQGRLNLLETHPIQSAPTEPLRPPDSPSHKAAAICCFADVGPKQAVWTAYLEAAVPLPSMQKPNA